MKHNYSVLAKCRIYYRYNRRHIYLPLWVTSKAERLLYIPSILTLKALSFASCLFISVLKVIYVFCEVGIEFVSIICVNFRL